MPPGPALTKKISLKPTTRIPDANAILQNQEIKEKKEEHSQVAETPMPVMNEPVTLDNLKKHWKDFADKRREEGKDAEYVLLNQDIVLTKENVIEIKLTNVVEQPILEGVRTDLLQYLRTKLKNQFLSLEAKLIQMESNEMIYTDRERFNYLAGKYPHLKKLQERLGLDPDH